MKKQLIYLFLIFLLMLPCYGNIVGTVDGENIYLNNFNRLYNAQKKRFQKEFNLNLHSELDPKVISKRKEFLLKAKIEGIDISEDKLREIPDEIKQRVKENMILEKYFEKHARQKVLELMINEQLALQAARERKINISDAEIIKKINAIKEKEGGEEGFLKFLESNNATIDDAKNEIKNKLIYEKIKSSFTKEEDFKDFLHNKKINADIVVYYNKIFEEQSPQEISLRAQAKELTKEDIAKSLGLTPQNQSSTNPNLIVTIHKKTNTDEIIKNLGLIPNNPELINPDLSVSLNYKQEAIKQEETSFLSHLKSLFKRKGKLELNEIPLLTPEQQLLLDNQIRLREEIEIK